MPTTVPVSSPKGRWGAQHPAVPEAQGGPPAGAPARLVWGQDRAQPGPAGRGVCRLRPPRGLLVAAADGRLPGGGVRPDRVRRPRRRPPGDPGFPTPANDLLALLLINLLSVRARLVGGQAQPPPRQPQPLDVDPDIGFPALALAEEQARSQDGRLPVRRPYQAWFFFPLLCWKRSTCRPHQPRRGSGRSQTWSSASCWWPTRRLSRRAGPRAVAGQAVAFILIHQALFGLYLGCSSPPTTRGCRPSATPTRWASSGARC